jgi:hypothetical protein
VLFAVEGFVCLNRPPGVLNDFIVEVFVIDDEVRELAPQLLVPDSCVSKAPYCLSHAFSMEILCLSLEYRYDDSLVVLLVTGVVALQDVEGVRCERYWNVVLYWIKDCELSVQES